MNGWPGGFFTDLTISAARILVDIGGDDQSTQAIMHFSGGQHDARPWDRDSSARSPHESPGQLRVTRVSEFAHHQRVIACFGNLPGRFRPSGAYTLGRPAQHKGVSFYGHFDFRMAAQPELCEDRLGYDDALRVPYPPDVNMHGFHRSNNVKTARKIKRFAERFATRGRQVDGTLMNRHLLVMAGVWCFPALHAQPKFEVVSIKECKANDPAPPSNSSPVRLSLGCWPLWRLIAEAYDTYASGKVDPLKLLFPRPLEAAPSWINSARYTIDAKAESPQSGAMMRGPMMQALLEDRFRLKIHRETREVSGYLMTVAKGGLKVKPTAEGSCISVDPTDFSQSGKPDPSGKPTTRVVRGIRYPWNHGLPVIDQTGVTGRFDIHLEWESGTPRRLWRCASSSVCGSNLARVRTRCW